MKIRYAGDSSEKQLQKILDKLTPVCQECTLKKLYICIEKCCSNSDAFVCLDCDQSHRLHRKNELRLLFLDYSHLEPFTVIQKRKISELSQFLTEQKKRSEELIEKQLLLVSLYAHALAELAKAFPTEEQMWLEKAYEIVKDNVFKSRLDKQVRAQFYKEMGQMNLHVADPIPNLEQVNIVKKSLAEYADNPLKFVNEQKTVTVLQKLTEIQQKKSNKCVEEFVLRTNIEKYLSYLPNEFETIVTNTTNRSKQIVALLVIKQELQANRVILTKFLEYKLQCVVGDQVTQLHTTVYIEKLPCQLQSLSYHAWQYDPLNKNKQPKEFPSTIKTLRIQQAFTPNPRMPYDFDHLASLKYLVIADNQLTKKQLRKIVAFSIKNQLRMLCLLNGPIRQNYNKVVNFWAKVQACYTHRYPSLQRRYLIYKRKLLQISLMARTAHIRKSYWAEHILNFASSKLEQND